MLVAIIHVGGKKYEVNGVGNLLEACLSLGLDIPYSCQRSALGSVGACRQCAVKQYQNTEDTHGRSVMSCMAPASDGTFISIDDGEAKQFREDAAEWLMTNHPCGCPVCEEGGSRHLQDMTMMTRHSFRRYRFIKRTHRNQDLGPFISHKTSRYIACYCCVRYYKNYANGMDLDVYSAHNNIYFGRPENDMLKSESSGNLVEIYPADVFTDKTHLERYNRKWDIQFAPSIRQQCSIGCSISPGERYGELRRIENRYNDIVNHYFLCDRGRFGYGYVNLKDRPRQPVQHRGNDFITLNTEQAMQGAIDILRQLEGMINISSLCASVEGSFALRKLVGEESFYTGITHGEQECLQLVLRMLCGSGTYAPALREIESYDAVLALDEDVTQTDARVTLTVRQAVRGKVREVAATQKMVNWQVAAILNIGQRAKHLLFVTNVGDTRLDDIAAWTYCAPVEDQARLGFAITHTLDNPASAVNGIEPELQSKIDVIVQALAGAKKPLIISGTNADSAKVIQAAANMTKALKGCSADVGITMIVCPVNSIRLGIVGGGSFEEALTELEIGCADTVVVLESDLYRHASATRTNTMLAKAPLVVVVDHQRTAIMESAHLVLSVTNFAESDGTVTDNEGRAQHLFQIYDPAYYDSEIVMLENWRWLHSLYNTLLSREVDRMQFDRMIGAVVAKIPELAGIKGAVSNATFCVHGQKPAREPYRYNDRTTMHTSISVHGPRQPQDIDTMFVFSIKGNNQPTAHRPQAPSAWASGWNSPQTRNKFQDEVGGKLRFGDSGVRLFEASENGLDCFTSVSAHFRPQDGKWRIAPYYHLSDNDELSQRIPVFQNHMPQPYIKFNLADAAKLGMNAGICVPFSHNGNTATLPVEIAEGLTAGQVGLPMDISGIAPILVGAHLGDLKEAQQ